MLVKRPSRKKKVSFYFNKMKRNSNEVVKLLERKTYFMFKNIKIKMHR
jgi:hypothetical protein